MKQKLSKKGIELPISMIIVLILSIVIFAFGITILFKSYRWATETSAEIDASTQKQIESVLLEGNAIVALPKTTQKANVGQQVAFGLGIRNIGDKGEFSVTLGFAGAYLPNDEQITTTDSTIIEEQWLGGLKQQTGITIKRDEIYTVPLRIRAGNRISNSENTKKGTYVFNICVFKGPAQDCVANTPGLYDKQVHQVTIIV